MGLELWTRVRSLVHRGGARKDRGSLCVVVAATAAGVVGAVLLVDDVPTTAVGTGRAAVFAAGLVLMWVGVALRRWAVVVLGRFFTVGVRVQDDQTVVERGPYRWVRRPSYAGLLITLVGLGLALTNWLSLLVLAVVPTAGLVVRIHVEERALLEALGEPNRRYAAGRRRLVPGVW